jgi:tRNA modification GTPase
MRVILNVENFRRSNHPYPNPLPAYREGGKVFMHAGDTIAAISSSIGPSSRIILRLSGPSSHSIARSIAPDWKPDHASASYTILSFANLRCPSWLYTFTSPHSYTGEDLIEFHLPGSPVLAKLLLDDLLHRNVRLAEAGEFTARAYFAGKLDLTEAEGVAATIAASNEQELQAARQLLAGELARRLQPTMELITQTLALIEVGIDFSEENVTFLQGSEILHRFEQIDGDLVQLLDDTSRFEQLAHEPRIVLVGRPNAGKSTLINALTGQPRAVVSSTAGTTRDVLTAELNLPHGRVLLTDVAGIEAGTVHENRIADLMQQHAQRALESADRVVLIHDASENIPPLVLTRSVDLFVFSKADLLPASKTNTGEIRVSAKTGAGMDELREAIDRLAFGQEGRAGTLALNSRHVAAVLEAREAIARATSCTNNAAAELIALELREALDVLGRVLGCVTPDDVLGRIFSTFCIGK